LRRELVENHQLQAIISMPSGVFKPYAGVSTAVLVFTKTGAGGTNKVWFYNMKADGFSLDDKRSTIDANDIPDILVRFHNLEGDADRKPTEQSFFVGKSAIEANDYDLSINRYKEVVHEKVDYDTPKVIMSRLDKLNLDIASKMEELRGLISE
jgi:type I restriction enzyme M protein